MTYYCNWRLENQIRRHFMLSTVLDDVLIDKLELFRRALAYV